MLLVRLDAIGDALTMVPLLAALRRRAIRIGAVLRPVNAQVFSRRGLDRLHVAGERPMSELVTEIQDQAYDVALVATEKPEGYRLAYRARIAERIGFENGWGKPLKSLWIRRMCTQTVFRTAGLDPAGPHECEVVYALAGRLVQDPYPPRDARDLRPYVIDEEPPQDHRVLFQVTDKWQRLGATLDRVVDLARRIQEKHALRFVAAERELSYAREFASRAGFEIETFSAAPPWKSAIAAARGVIAPDSGAAHVAGMVGTPVVSCFATRDFALQSSRWSPWAAAHQLVRIESDWTLAAADALDELLNDKPGSAYTG